MNKVILNSKGEQIVLNDLEKRVALINQEKANALGYEIDVTTLTTIMKKVTEQKFFEIMPADYLPVRVGEGAWSSNLVTYRSFALGEDFESGVINTAGNNGKLAAADAGVDSITVKVINWAKSIGWTLFDLQLASKSGNWDLVTAKERARLKNFQLGLQKIAFLGSASDAAVMGLLTQSDVLVNDTILADPIKDLSAADFSTFVAGIYEDYRSNSARTSKPTHFIIPESDFNGLTVPTSSTYPLKTKLQLLEESFQTITMNKGFKILPCAYGDTAYSGRTYPRYALLNYEEESLRMDIPVDYTNTLANSIDNFAFQNVGYAQFTGVKAYRPKEMLYLDQK